MGTRLRSSTRASTAASDNLAEQAAEPKSKADSRSRAPSAKTPRGSELVRLRRIALAAFFVSSLIIAGVIYFSLNDTLKLYPKSITKPDALKGFNARFEYAVRYQTLLTLWLVFMVNWVIYTRITRGALNPLVETTEKYAQMQKNILTNSIEQLVMSAFLQYAFVSFADPGLVMRLIPAVNVVQFIGRIAFFFGYPLYRTLGISLTLSPNLLMVGYNVYKFGSYLSFY